MCYTCPANPPTFFPSRLIASPTELIKIRQQNVLANDPANAPAFKVAMTIFKQHGIRGLYRGLTATALRDTGYGTYFLTVRSPRFEGDDE